MSLAERLERRGDVSLLTRPLHRFIGEAIGTRTEVLSVLHLLDKPDATWEDPGMDRIYGDLRCEFVIDRNEALEQIWTQASLPAPETAAFPGGGDG